MLEICEREIAQCSSCYHLQCCTSTFKLPSNKDLFSCAYYDNRFLDWHEDLSIIDFDGYEGSFKYE